MIKDDYSFIKPLIFAEKNERYFSVKGNSMWPLLKDGQRVKITAIRKPFKRGKCYLFVNKNVLYIHRLLRIYDKKAFLIGDYSEKIEEVPLEAIIGEFEYNQNGVTLFILNLLNWIYINTVPGIFRRMRLRNRVFSMLSKLEKLQ
jgi:hypothetical protein